jgi:hypothetical protein
LNYQSKRIHKQIALGDLFQLEVSGVDSADVSAESEVQKSEKMSRLQFVFAGDQRPFSVIFQSSTLCVAFCDRVHVCFLLRLH